jgi:signal transduction histidine kinase
MRLNPAFLRSFPSSLFARISLILLLGLFAAQLVSVWLQSGERARVVMQARGQNFADRIVEAIRVLETSDPAHRADTLLALQSRDLRVMLLTQAQVSPNVPHGQIQSMLGLRLGGEREIRSPGGASGMPQRDSPLRVFDVRLRDGQWIRVTTTVNAEAPALPANLITSLVVTLFIVMVFVMIAVRQVSQPLKRLAEAADTLGRDLAAAPLAEKGSTEMRSAAQAFNRMQARIRHLIDERARALAAVSHDLRTPLTRMRLRAELVDDEKLREQMAADLDSMAAMLDSSLDYLRGLQDREVVRRIDMNALLQSMVEDAELLGKTVSIEGLAQAPYAGRLLALQRALQNLIDNAIKYGFSAHIRVGDDATALRISVEDEGPGIPHKEITRVTEPYYRPDASRNADTGGVGLGLSIVKDIALMHGGELILANKPGGGLSATLVLPRQSAT